jgi:predicted MPP superfamily phosphohydrolase
MALTIFLFSLILYVYVGWRLADGLGTLMPQYAGGIRRGVALAFLGVSLFPIVVLAYFGAGILDSLFVFRNEVNWGDYLLHYPFWIGLIIILEVAPYFLAADLLHLTLRLFAASTLKIWVGKLAVVKVVLFFAILINVGYRSYIDTNRINRSTYTLALDNLPESLENLNLALVADIQVDRFVSDEKIEMLHEKLDEIDPDLLFFAGDIVTQGVHFIPKALGALCETDAKIERIAALGDHDYWSGADAVSSGLRDCDWRFLENEHHVIQHDSATILVTGITHIYSKRISPDALDSILSSAPVADVKILLVHQPGEIVIQAAARNGYHLLLAGHTHGGQLIFKPFGFPFSPSQLENPIYSGHGKAGRLNVIVTNGIGFTLAPVRYRAQGEVVEIRLIRDGERPD